MNRAERRRKRRREKLLNEAERLDHQLGWSSDFFIGTVAGPRRRADLIARIKEVREELEAMEAEE